MSVKPCLTLDVAPVVNGVTWQLYSFNYDTADGNGSSWLYALSFEHAAARLAELKESAVLFDEVLGSKPVGHRDLIEILNRIKNWHSKQLDQLQSLVNAPDDTDIVLQGANGKRVEIQGEARKGFKAALRVAVEAFSPLPFQIEPTDDDQEEE